MLCKAAPDPDEWTRHPVDPALRCHCLRPRCILTGLHFCQLAHAGPPLVGSPSECHPRVLGQILGWCAWHLTEAAWHSWLTTCCRQEECGPAYWESGCQGWEALIELQSRCLSACQVAVGRLLQSQGPHNAGGLHYASLQAHLWAYGNAQCVAVLPQIEMQAV